MHKAKSIDPVPYGSTDDQIVAQALEILRARVRSGPVMSSPAKCRDYLILAHSAREIEQFDVLYLDSQNRLIAHDIAFTGTLNQTSVYPREIVRAALKHNAASVILSHNHPSGHPEPSRSDEQLTQTLKTALDLIDVRVLDHIVTGGASSVSFAERGLL